MVDCSVGWLVGRLNGLMVDGFVCRLIVWMASWLVDLFFFIGWFVG